MFANVMDYLNALNRSEPGVPLIVEAAQAVPEMSLLPFFPTKGPSHTYIRISKLPAGGFRNLNQGIDATDEDGEEVTESAKRFETLIKADKAFVAGYAGTLGDYMKAKGKLGVQGNLQGIASQLYYGVKNDAKGFDGLVKLISPDLVISASKETPTGAYSSAYIVYFDSELGTSFFGPDNENEHPFELGDTKEGLLKDAQGKEYPGYYATAGGWLGLSLRHTKSAGRIKHITSSTPLTAELLDDILEKMPDGMDRSKMAILMNRKTYNGFKRSYAQKIEIEAGEQTIGINTTVNALEVTSYDDIRIVRTDNIANDERLLEATA